MTDKRKALGRGLAALIPGAGAAPGGGAQSVLRREFFECAIEELHPSDDNPRQIFDDLRLAELAESIRKQGLVQPLVVRQRKEGGYAIVAGERRWRAAQRAGLQRLPVWVKELTPKDAFEAMLVENLQRADLSPIEEAEAYQRLVSDHGYTQEQVAERVGKDRSTVTNALRLLKLPPAVRTLVGDGRLSMGHARALLGLERGPAIERAAERVVGKQLSVRQTEALVRREREGAPANDRDGRGGTGRPAPSAAVRNLEQRLERALGTRVRVMQKDKQHGTVEIEYHSLDQLDGLLERMLRR